MVDPDIHAIAERIKYARAHARLGSRELAAKAGLASGSVSSLESGHVRRVELRTMLRLADALGVSRAWLCWDEQPMLVAEASRQKST